DAHAAHEPRLLAQPLHEGPDLGPAAVDDDRPNADKPQQEDVLGELLLEARLLHGGPAVLDDQRLPLERADVRQRLHQDLGPVVRGVHYTRRGAPPPFRILPPGIDCAGKASARRSSLSREAGKAGARASSLSREPFSNARLDDRSVTRSQDIA